MSDKPDLRTPPPPAPSAGLPPPQDIETERAVLASMLVDPTAAGPILDVLVSDDAFYDRKHQQVAAAIRRLYTEGSPVDLVTVSAALRADGTYDEIGGYYLAELSSRAASGTNGVYYARLVAEKWLLRGIVQVSRKAVGAAYEAAADPFTVLDSLDRRVWRIQQQVAGSTLRRTADVMPAVLGHLDGTVPGAGLVATTGYPALDAVIGGWWEQAHQVFAAASATGKTTLGLGFTRAAAVEQGIGVAYFSVEVGAAKLTQRLVGMDARVGARAVRDATLLPGDQEKLHEAAQRVAAAPIFFDDTPSLHIHQVETRARRLVQHEGVRLIIVDYVQRIGYEGLARDLERGTSIVSGRLKALARELNVPVVSFSQVTKDAGRACRKGTRPDLNDLRGSEDVGNDADTVGIIYRPAAYGLEYDEPTQRRAEGWAEVLFRKVRDGEAGTALLGYNTRLAAFTNGLPDGIGPKGEDADLFPYGAPSGNAPF